MRAVLGILASASFFWVRLRFQDSKRRFFLGDGLCVAPFWTFCLTCARWHASCLACRHLFVWVDYMLTFVSTHFAPFGAPPHLQLQCTAAVVYPVSCSGSENQLCVKRLVAWKSNPKSGFVSGTESCSRKSACWEAVVQLQTKMLLLSRLLLILLVPLLFFSAVEVHSAISEHLGPLATIRLP